MKLTLISATHFFSAVGDAFKKLSSQFSRELAKQNRSWLSSEFYPGGVEVLYRNLAMPRGDVSAPWLRHDISEVLRLRSDSGKFRIFWEIL